MKQVLIIRVIASCIVGIIGLFCVSFYSQFKIYWDYQEFEREGPNEIVENLMNVDKMIFLFGFVIMLVVVVKNLIVLIGELSKEVFPPKIEQ